MATQYEIIGPSEGFPGQNKVVTKSISQVTFDTLCFNFAQGSGSSKVSHADLKKCIVTAYLQNAGLVQNLVDNVRLYDIISYQEHIGGVGVEVGDDSYMIGRLPLNTVVLGDTQLYVELRYLDIGSFDSSPQLEVVAARLADDEETGIILKYQGKTVTTDGVTIPNALCVYAVDEGKTSVKTARITFPDGSELNQVIRRDWYATQMLGQQSFDLDMALIYLDKDMLVGRSVNIRPSAPMSIFCISRFLPAGN